MKQCGFVIRVSTEEQALNKEGSLTTQLQRLTAHVEYKKTCGEDWEEADRYIMKGVSGKDSVRSPEFARLFADIEAGRVNTVICTALDRVSRSVKDFLNFFEFLNEHDVEFVCLKQNYDTTSPQGKLFITIMMALAEFEREQTSERNKDATLARAERGLWNGGQLLGFDLDPERKGYLLPNERERAIIDFAMDTYLECGSILKTVKRMNERGYRTKEYRSRREKFHAASEFGHASVQQLLTNLAYIGKKEIHKKTRGKDQEKLPEAKRYRVVNAVWEPIVDEEKFYRVQELLKTNNKSKHNGMRPGRHTYVLNAGLLWCGHCGEKMEGRAGTGRKGKKYYYYVCTHTDCKFKVRADDVEGAVLARIGALAREPEVLGAIVDETNKKLQTELPKLTEQRATLERELEEVNNQARGLLDAVAGEGVFVKERLEALEKRRGQLEKGREEVALLMNDIEHEAVDRELVAAALADFTEVYDHIPPYKRKELMRLVLQKAVASERAIILGLYGRPPKVSEMAQDGSRSQTSNWLPG